MLSKSSLSITWQKPDPHAEEWEIRHPAKQDFYRSSNISWEKILSEFDKGRMVEYPRSGEIIGCRVVNSNHTYEEYDRYLAKAKRGYRLNYNRMEKSLQRCGTLSLPAPIVLVSGGNALIFSGYRRLCLSWNYGIIPYVWLVEMQAIDFS